VQHALILHHLWALIGDATSTGKDSRHPRAALVAPPFNDASSTVVCTAKQALKSSSLRASDLRSMQTWYTGKHKSKGGHGGMPVKN
jgi:hypothetical protein